MGMGGCVCRWMDGWMVFGDKMNIVWDEDIYADICDLTPLI